MTEPPPSPEGFEPAALRGLEEPVRRYLTHALAPGAPVGCGRRFGMVGRIRVGCWLAFDAEQEMAGDGHGFTWTARAGLGPVRPLRVVDRYGTVRYRPFFEPRSAGRVRPDRGAARSRRPPCERGR